MTHRKSWAYCFSWFGLLFSVSQGLHVSFFSKDAVAKASGKRTDSAVAKK